MQGGREWHEMGLRGGMGQINHGLDGGWKEFQFSTLGEMGSHGRAVNSGVLCELWMCKNSALADM